MSRSTSRQQSGPSEMRWTHTRSVWGVVEIGDKHAQEGPERFRRTHKAFGDQTALAMVRGKRDKRNMDRIPGQGQVRKPLLTQRLASRQLQKPKASCRGTSVFGRRVREPLSFAIKVRMRRRTREWSRCERCSISFIFLTNPRHNSVTQGGRGFVRRFTICFICILHNISVT